MVRLEALLAIHASSEPLGETIDEAGALAPLGSAPVREKGAEMEEGRLEERNTCWYCAGYRARSRSLGATPKSMHAFSHFIYIR